jgi:hypothetical protein
MSGTVNFRDFQMNDNNDAVTIEGVIRRFGAFGGVHQFEFVDDISGFNEDKWDAVTDVSYASGYVGRTGTIGVDTPIWYSDPLPHSYVFEFTAHEPTWRVYFRADAAGTNNNSYHVDYDGTDLTVVGKIGGVETILLQKELRPDEVVDWGRVKISVRDTQFNSEDIGRIIYIGVWLNDQLIGAAADNVTEGTPPLYMGFLIPAGDAGIVYSDFRVPNLGEIIPWSSLDPAEYPMDGIRRAIEDRYIKMWMRWNGAMKAWKPKARPVAASVIASKEFGHRRTIDQRQIFSHVRVVGAFQWVQAIDADLVRDFGNRFREVNNTSLWDIDDCSRLAEAILMRVKEQIYQASFSSFGYMYLEYEDRLQLPDPNDPDAVIDYIFNSGTWTSQDSTFELQLEVRQYFYGEPEDA